MRIRNVFVLCTGRCGSTTFSRAFAHATNYTSGHETRCTMLGAARFAYPAYHIEADNRLSWLLGRLDRAFGGDAFYVHLTRNRDDVAASVARRWNKGIFGAYHGEILMGNDRRPGKVRPRRCAYDYVDTVTENIAAFLRDKPLRMDFRLETAADDTRRLWQALGLEGDLDAAVAEWNTRHNATASAPPAAPAPAEPGH